jgi:hypothetical protein
MRFWQWVLIALVIVGLGLVARPTPGMAASFERSATTLINYGGDMWLMGDPDGGGGGYQQPNDGYRLRKVTQGDLVSPRALLFAHWLVCLQLRYLANR